MKKVLSLLLVLVMLIGMMPTTVFATEEIEVTEVTNVSEVTEKTEETEETEEPSESEETGEAEEPSESVETEEPSEAEESEATEPTETTETEKPEVIHEHDYEAEVTGPTCTKQGYTTYTCECGDSYVDDNVDATGDHTYENGTCTGCGATTSPYLQQLPENIIGCTNLYDSLVPVKGYYTATKYDTSNGAVLSVVIPVEPGDRIAASSFGSVSENMGSVNGIRVTYLLGDKIATSLSAGDVYNGYTKNGYITVPDGVDAVCVPWWKPSDSNWLTLSQISKDFAVHSPKAIPAQAPTCTENGYTAGEICEICGASLGSREEIPATGHDYIGNTCTICGTVNDLAILDGKYVSVLGDSISTFNGYSNDATVNTTIGGNGPRYDAGTANTKPGSYCLLESVNDTWWMHFANRSGMKLLVNNSWAGSQVFGGKTSDGRVIPAAYLDRCVNLHDNTLENNPGNATINPDVIFVYLGINDYNFNRSKVGTDAVDYARLVNSDGTYVTPATFGEAYGIMLHKMRNTYPDAQIFAMTLLPENLYSVDKTAWEQHNVYIRAAAEYFDIPLVDLAKNCAITWENYSGYMIDKIHPTTAGMKLISDCIEAELVAYYKENRPHTHTYETSVTAPTCTEQGYTTYTCECGDSYVDDYVDATGHNYKNGICTGCSAANPDASESMSLRYDDHYDITGKTVEIIDAGKPTSYQVGYDVATGTLDTAVVTVEDNFLVATGIGTAKVKIDDQLYDVTVEKAKINLIVIMGQSNAGNHFENATSDVTCPIGTAYWWGNGKGTAATEPVPYTQPSMGFHTPLLAELYAQSVAAGDPVKNVLIWQEGITSKNGQSIAKWAASATNTSGTDATVTMIQNCRNYYEKQSDKYEIVNSGVYWLQGESDTAMDPALYTQLFMAIWERLENAGMEYLAFLRLRWGVNGNGLDHQDLHHSASLSAQIQMINKNPNFYMATDLTENWVGTETATHTVDISKYITVMEAYGNNPTYTDIYGNHATYADGRLTTTMKSLYGSNNKCHYGKFGYGLIGADAAYNMYNALKTNDSAIVVTDTSGHANRKKLLTNGQQMTIDITNMSDDLSIRPACGSTAGTLEIVIRSGKDDITNHDGLLIADGLRYGSICVSELRNYNNTSIEITYKTANGKKHTAVCNVITQLAGPKKDYIWNFNEDLYARDEEGNILNSFLIEPLAGSYTLENGYLTGNALMLQLEQLIELEADKNWCVEWKYGTFVNGSAGFLLCEEATNSMGNKAFYHTSTGRMMISDYADKKGYRNYTSSAVVIDEYDCLRITNSYDPTTGKSMLSLWKNGELVIENFQMKGSLNSDTDILDMTGYPLDGNFAFGYLGHDKNSLWGMNCELDYLHISFGEEKEWCDNAFGPVITQQPVNGEAKLGERYMVEVKAEGEGLTYQWYFRNAGSNAWYKSSVKDNTYDDVMTTARAGREVYCVITDANGNTVTTDTAKLICTPSVELEIITQPTNAEAALGERYCVTVEAKGEGLKYQWYFRNAGAKEFSVSSVKDNTYDDVMTTARDGREVYCVITDVSGNTVTTDTVKLIRIASEELAITKQPVNGEAKLGETYCVSVEAKGEGLKYQWYFRNPGAKDFTKSSVTDNTYDDVLTTSRVDREVYCVITDAFGNTVTTDTVKLIRTYEELAITAQPEDSETAMGEMFCVTVEAKGESLKYQWFYRNGGSETWQKSGVRDNTYDDVMTTARANREVYCVITDRFGNTVTTDIAKLIPVATVELKLLGQSYESAVMGERYCVTVEAQGDGLTYQWYFRNAGSNAWYKSSVTDNTYDDVMTKARANRDVYCVITDACGNQVTTEVVTLILTK